MVRDGLFLFQEKTYLISTSPLVVQVIAGFHNLAHEGVEKTGSRPSLFLLEGLEEVYPRVRLALSSLLEIQV